MNDQHIKSARWHALAVATGIGSGFVAAVLALLISGNTYNLHLPEWSIWLPLPILPGLSLAALSKAVSPTGRIERVSGAIAFVLAALSGIFLLAVLIARADHGGVS
jgi:hypothetical protein